MNLFFFQNDNLLKAYKYKFLHDFLPNMSQHVNIQPTSCYMLLKLVNIHEIKRCTYTNQVVMFVFNKRQNFNCKFTVHLIISVLRLMVVRLLCSKS